MIYMPTEDLQFVIFIGNSLNMGIDWIYVLGRHYVLFEGLQDLSW